MPIGSDLDIDVPVLEPPEDRDSPAVAAAKIVDGLEKLRDACEGTVPIAAVDISSEVDFQAQGATGVAHVGLDNLADNNSNDDGELFRHNNDLYWVHPGGAVRITDGTGLNAAGIGGIGGDYGASTEEVYYTAATDEYSFTDAPGNYSDVVVSGVKFEGGSADYILVRPSGFGSSTPQEVTVNFPAGTTTRIVGISATEAIGPIATTDEPFEFTGALTLPTDSNFKQGALEGSTGFPHQPNTTLDSDSDALLLTNTFRARCYLPLRKGDRLTRVDVYRTAATATTFEWRVYKLDSAGASTLIGTLSDPAVASWNVAPIDITDTTLTDGDQVWVGVTANGGTGPRVGCVNYTYDRP